MFTNAKTKKSDNAWISCFLLCVILNYFWAKNNFLESKKICMNIKMKIDIIWMFSYVVWYSLIRWLASEGKKMEQVNKPECTAQCISITPDNYIFLYFFERRPIIGGRLGSGERWSVS